MLTSILAGLLSAVVLHKAPLRGDVGLALALALLSALYTIIHRTSDNGRLISFYIASSAITVYLSSIWIFTMIYRLSAFHPLARFPGPIVNRTTALKSLFVTYTGKHYLYIDALHRKYGKVVRTGPNSLSINSHAAVSPLYASSSSYDKSQAYVLGRVRGTGLFFITGREQHNTRRRLWAPGFSAEALENQAIIMENRTLQLKTCIEKRCSPEGVVNLGECILHWSFDFMNDLVFGGSNKVELMQDGDPVGYVDSGKLAMVTFDVLAEVPPLFDILWYLPISRKIKKLEKLAEQLLTSREKNDTSNQNDIVAHLLGVHTPTNLTFEDRRVESLFSMQAGGDTTSGVLIYLFFLLISHKQVYSRLQAELDSYFDDPDAPISTATLASIPYLDAVVQESLRIGAPLPSLPRVVPPGGLALEDDVYIPGGTVVSVPPYTQQLAEENFYPDPHAFKPERWLPDGLGAGTRTRKEAIMSFSYGTFGCLGRNIAIMELRLVTARLIRANDFSFAPGFDEAAFVDGVQNMRTTIFAYPLKVVAIPRKR